MFIQGKRYKHKKIPNYIVEAMYVGGNDIETGRPVVILKILDVGAFVEEHYGDEYQIDPIDQIILLYEEVA